MAPDEGRGALAEFQRLRSFQRAIQLEENRPLIPRITFDLGRRLARRRPHVNGLDEARVNGPVHGDDPTRSEEEPGGLQRAFLGHQFRQGMHGVVAGTRIHIRHPAGGFPLVELEIDLHPDHARRDGSQCGLGGVSRSGVQPGDRQEQPSGEECDVQAVHDPRLCGGIDLGQALWGGSGATWAGACSNGSQSLLTSSPT